MKYFELCFDSHNWAYPSQVFLNIGTLCSELSMIFNFDDDLNNVWLTIKYRRLVLDEKYRCLESYSSSSILGSRTDIQNNVQFKICLAKSRKTLHHLADVCNVNGGFNA